MIETIMAWLLLIFAIVSGDPSWYIASGVFAVACEIRCVVERMNERSDREK